MSAVQYHREMAQLVDSVALGREVNAALIAEARVLVGLALGLEPIAEG